MLLIYLKQTIKNYKKIIATFLEILGSLTIIYQILEIFFPNYIKNINFNYIGFIIMLSIILFISILWNIPRLKRTFNIKNRDINITIVVGNIFKQTGSVVIPTNTTYDTCMDNEFISKKSVQGQFQELYFKDNVDVLDSILAKSLIDTPVLERLTDNRNTKLERYTCGDVAKLNYNNKRFYFLAIADVKKNGTPIATYDNILIALQGLWTFLSENKHIEDLVMPIIGTGRAGIVDATRIRVIKDTILSFIAISTETKITNNLVICIHPNDLKNNKIDIDEIFEYVEYMSKYRYEQIDNKKSGLPLE